MSNPLAIAAATATLQQVLIKGVGDLPNQNVTAKPLDRVRDGNAKQTDQLNIFLYQTVLNGAWRNMDMPGQIRSGETAQPPLALNLHYLVTAFGKDDDDTLGHHWLGEAMSILHDHPVLSAADIQGVLPADSGLQGQIERVRITPLALSIEEISKLWTAFQVQYRISAAYELAVVLIESKRPGFSPLPVLKRGSGDQGVISVASAPPSISEIEPDLKPRDFRKSAKLGDNLKITGDNLPTDGFVVRFTRQPVPASPAVAETLNLTPLPGGKDGEIKVALKDDGAAMSAWAPGLYTVSVVLTLPGPINWTTNEIPIALAPIITVAPLNAAAGDVTLTITCKPRVRPEQRVLLLVADKQIPVKTMSNPADTTKPTQFTFLVPALTKGTYVIRLRVDGVDSIPVTLAGNPPLPAFDPNQTLTIP